MEGKSFYILQQSVNRYFEEINSQNVVVKSNSCIRAMLFDNIYTANSFKTLLNKHYSEKFKVINL